MDTKQSQSLEEESIRTCLTPTDNQKCQKMHILESVDSTNMWLMSKIKSREARRGDVCLAESQASGRGQLGKNWHSPGNGNLYLSVAWDTGENGRFPEQTKLLPVAIGFCIAEFLQQECGAGIALKWPNDVLLNNKKICGVLVESQLCGRSGYWVMGVGLNLSWVEVLEQVKILPGALIEVVPDCLDRRNYFVAGLISSVYRACELVDSGKTGLVIAGWDAFDFLKGKQIEIYQDTSLVGSGIVDGLNLDGGIRVHCDGYTKIFYSGDIRIQ